ncbi:hypothetical protein K437DRAFT_220580 [Tilletiaria anomala UBC 951]|uniref:EthD domain-containing protein n=1 Tax=Tilletiaria anomala (strain ATCC 24038 / CBS 436.72 / UBC 951) TaxID=1037660 RepID=A0A066WP78_TILAU|nr:uncharacterized protein K437DRAFT_220580 [Tilletiaria anomala UBC 951]KDN52415.1 hypothetical protein K437DRAFT_220580 [Tilletiaria anomala UBC 951]
MGDPRYKSSDSGLLLVFSEPGQNATLEEFHDWYDTEHVPLRTSRFPEFRSAARYQVISSASSFGSDASSSPAWMTSGWAALYTISSNALYNNPAYANLRSNRSLREAELLSRVAILDRRIYTLQSDTEASSSSTEGTPNASLRPQSASEIELNAPIVVATSVTLVNEEAQKAYDEWYDTEHVPMLMKVPGWKRTRRFVLIDAFINGKLAGKENEDGKSVPTCLGLHEYENNDFASTPEYKAALNTEWRRKVMGQDDKNVKARERRVMKLYRAWDPETALKEQAN